LVLKYRKTINKFAHSVQQKNSYSGRFEFLMVMNIKSTVF
jgi:hypothetical protein